MQNLGLVSLVLFEGSVSSSLEGKGQGGHGGNDTVCEAPSWEKV